MAMNKADMLFSKLVDLALSVLKKHNTTKHPPQKNPKPNTPQKTP